MSQQQSAPTASQQDSKAYLGWVMFVLVVVYTFNFIDRSIISILAIPIQQELGVTDFQMGLMR
ncbi:Uncharacterized MFS-type transporter, partial [hydrothermal vent metagenome]